MTDGSGRDRRWLRSGAQLLNDAGIALKNGKRLMPDGKPITMEFLLDETTFTPHHLPYIKNLGVLGINATLRIVDPVQYRARVDGFDFDITVERFSFSATPGDLLRTYFSSLAAATKGSQNLAGIADPAVDALVDIIIAAKTRPELDNRVQGARPRHPRRALLDSALVQSVTLDRFLGRVRPPRRQTALFPGHSGKPGGTTRTRQRSSTGKAERHGPTCGNALHFAQFGRARVARPIHVFMLRYVIRR